MRLLDQKSNCKTIMRGDRKNHTRSPCRSVTHLLSQNSPLSKMADYYKREAWALSTSTLISTEEAHFHGGGFNPERVCFTVCSSGTSGPPYLTDIPLRTRWSAGSNSAMVTNRGRGRRCVSSFVSGHAIRAASMVIFSSSEVRTRVQNATFKF